MQQGILVFLVVAFTFLPICGQAATLYVEKLSNITYSVIQEAVDAAADGDTICIGPGRFQEHKTYQYHGWTQEIYVNLTKDVVLIGAGQDVTIIGPDSLDSNPVPSPKGIASVHEEISVKIQDLTVENIRDGIHWTKGLMDISDCIIRGCRYGIISYFGDGMMVRNCRFENIVGSGVVSFSGMESCLVENCWFEGDSFGTGVNTSGAQNVLVKDCEFRHLSVGIQFSLGGSGSVYNCNIFDMRFGLSFGSSFADVEETTVADCLWSNLNVDGGSVVTGRNNSFLGADGSTIAIGGLLTLHNCHIFNQGGLSIETGGYPPTTRIQHLENNWWGTTDVDQINEWIWDSNDQPEVNSWVKFLPLAGGPVSTETKSFGGLKSLYR